MVHKIDEGKVEFHATAEQLNGLEGLFSSQGHVELHLALEKDLTMKYMYDVHRKVSSEQVVIEHVSITAERNSKPDLFRCTLDAGDSNETNKKYFDILNEYNLGPQYMEKQ